MPKASRRIPRYKGSNPRNSVTSVWGHHSSNKHAQFIYTLMSAWICQSAHKYVCRFEFENKNGSRVIQSRELLQCSFRWENVSNWKYLFRIFDGVVVACSCLEVRDKCLRSVGNSQLSLGENTSDCVFLLMIAHYSPFVHWDYLLSHRLLYDVCDFYFIYKF